MGALLLLYQAEPRLEAGIRLVTDIGRAGGQKPEEDEEVLVGHNPMEVTYQVFCMSNIYIKSHNRGLERWLSG